VNGYAKGLHRWSEVADAGVIDIELDLVTAQLEPGGEVDELALSASRPEMIDYQK